MLCREIGYTAKAGERVFETTSVGTSTWEIFISYRQADAPGHAGRLGDSLVRHFGPGQVFKDLDSLTLGEAYVPAIREKLQRAFVMVVIIGPEWQTNPRLQEADDLHREEIRTALERGIEIVPVLVNGATMPKRKNLPEDTRELVGRQGIALLETYWTAGVDRVIQHVESVLEQSPRRLKFLAQVPPWDYSGWMSVEDEP
jgi:TIR domain